MSSVFQIFIILASFCGSQVDCVKEVFKKGGDVNIAVILRNECNGTVTLTASEQTLVNSAIWSIHQLNASENVSFGLSIHKTCNEKEDYETLFDLFRKKNEEILIGVVTTSKLSPKVLKFSAALEINVKYTNKCPLSLIEASIALLSTLKWDENITIVAPDESIVENFVKISQKSDICLDNYLVHGSKLPVNSSTVGHYVIFGNHTALSAILKTTDISEAILVALDGSTIKEIPDNSYFISSVEILPGFDIHEVNYFSPNSQIFEIATPLVAYVESLKMFIAESCNDVNLHLCLKNHFYKIPHVTLEQSQIIDLLKINTSSINYYIYKSDNSLGHIKVFSYNIFDDHLLQVGNSSEFLNSSSKVSCDFENTCQKQCKSLEIKNKINLIPDCEFRFRTDSWVYAFLSLSLLGVLLCVAVLIFLLVSVCRRNVLDGNPVLTLLLLLTVMLMYCSILPLSLEGNLISKKPICVARALSISLSFTAAFSLILSRSILLATASKDIGFMSHVAGPVQSFLCLFIFGVQAALSLQVVNHCYDIFKRHSFIYLMSYNIMLLLLLLCLCPLIVKSQRNYKEGKYFTLAVITISFLWCIWIPAYAFLEDKYKDSVLCFGLVSTASALMGTIFVPRTYLMTIAAAREKITSTLPSIATATSAMDIYRAGAQPVYDCVNVAAINAVAVARAGLTPLQQPDLYSCPNLPDDDDFDGRCGTPINDDKVTRF